MKVEIKVPSPGESVTSGILSKWLKPDGASVKEGDELFDFETDKATLAVPATGAGTLKHNAKEGDEVSVGQVVAIVDSEGSASPAPEAGKPAAMTSDATPTPESESPAVSDAVREFAEAEQVDLAAITGTGKDGRILKKDVQKAIEDEAPREAAPPAPAPSPAPAAPAAPREPMAIQSERQTREPMSQLRKRIAENLVRIKQESAHLTTFNEIDMSKIMQVRKTYGEAFEKQHGVKLGFMSLFVKAACRALHQHPGVNAIVDGDTIIFNHYYDIGVAVSTERGLIVPVVRGADTKGFAEIEKDIRDLATRAREKRLRVDELLGGTFTITNGGIFGSLLSTPIPTPPQTAILGMHTIQKRPVAIDDEVQIRPMMYVALTYDHRVIDGREAVGFLVKLKDIVEDPQSLLFEL